MSRCRRAGLMLSLFLMPLVATTCTVEAPPERSCTPSAEAADCGAASSESPAPSRGVVFRTWAPANERVGVIPRPDALEAARHFDLIVVSPSSVDAKDLAAMRRLDPELRILAYMNGAFAQARQGQAYPDSWYARDANGSKVRSVGYGNWLMDVTEHGWIDDRALTCERLLTVGLDGCMLDLLGTAPLLPGYATGIPIDARTHDAWRAEEWLAATSDIARTVQRLVRPAIVIGNGLASGPRFFDAAAPSSVLLDGVRGGIAEGWLRSSRQEIDAHPTLAAWLLDIEMLSTAGRHGKTVLVLTKAWAHGTRHQKDRLHEYALASFLLGMEGDAYFHFSYSPRSDPIHPHPWWDPDIGRAIESYGIVDGIYRRRFTRGLVLVNPTDETRTLQLDGAFVDLRGTPIRSATLSPRNGLVLLRASGA